MKVKNVGAFKVGDVVRFLRDRCDCCINLRSDIGAPESWTRDYKGTILSIDKLNGLVHIGFADSAACPAGIHAINDRDKDKDLGFRYGIRINQNTVCERLTAAKTSLTPSGSLGFLFACIGVGAGVSHYTCMQRNSPKENRMSLTK